MVNAGDYETLDLSHLHPSAHPVARLSVDERVQQIRADRWIGYPKAVEAVARLETLLGWPKKQRMPNLLLVGPTNNGKSMIIERFCRNHQPITKPDREHIPVVSVQMPSEPSPLRFYTAILAALGAPMRPRPRVIELEQLALSLLREVGARMLIIDELHNVLAGRSDVRREFLNLLRFLGNELRIPLCGTNIDCDLNAACNILSVATNANNYDACGTQESLNARPAAGRASAQPVATTLDGQAIASQVTPAKQLAGHPTQTEARSYKPDT